MKLITKEIENKFKEYPLYSQDEMLGNAKVIVKYFNPIGAGTWFITEGNKLDNGDYEMFGYCHLGDDLNAEFGTILLSELENLELPYGLKIERDLYLPEDCKLLEALYQSGITPPSYMLEDSVEVVCDNERIKFVTKDLALSYYHDLYELYDGEKSDKYLELYRLIKNNEYESDIFSYNGEIYTDGSIVEKTRDYTYDDYDSVWSVTIPCKLLDDGWNWQKFKDGSGCLLSPDGEDCLSYDLIANYYHLTNDLHTYFFPLSYNKDGKDSSKFNPFEYMERDMIERGLSREKTKESEEINL